MQGREAQAANAQTVTDQSKVWRARTTWNGEVGQHLARERGQRENEGRREGKYRIEKEASAGNEREGGRRPIKSVGYERGDVRRPIKSVGCGICTGVGQGMSIRGEADCSPCNQIVRSDGGKRHGSRTWVTVSENRQPEGCSNADWEGGKHRDGQWSCRWRTRIGKIGGTRTNFGTGFSFPRFQRIAGPGKSSIDGEGGFLERRAPKDAHQKR